MAKLILLVVAAVWAAVLIPPMLRSRVDNRPNSSVTDFRRQLNKLQSTATPARGSMRAMGRPLAQASSPMQRPAASARPSNPSQQRGASLRGGGTATRARSAPARQDNTGATSRYRTHGDPTGGQQRPQFREDGTPVQRRRQHPAQRQRQPQAANRRPEQQYSNQRQEAVSPDSNVAVRRRRLNIVFMLAVTAACTMFLSATTDSTVMLWLFAMSFLGLCGYLWALAQVRERDQAGWDNGWLDAR